MRLIIILLSATIIGFSSCGQGSQSGGEAGDGHAHDEKLLLASYNNEFEVFAEATPFSVGHASDILVHFSVLKNFKPLEQGNITANLVIGANTVRQSLEASAKPGIYKFKIKPELAGTGKLTFDIVTAEGTSQVIIPDITVYADEHEAQHKAIDMIVESSNGVVFTKEQSWNIEFATEEVRVEPFGQVIRSAAQILPSQGDERVITAKANGVVLFPAGNIVDGKAVGAGQSLFSIESSDLADNNLNVKYNESVSEYNRAKAEYERKSELAKDRIVSESDLLSAKTAFSNAEVIYNNMRRNFSSGKLLVSSPISGFVKQVLVRNGEYAEAGQAVLVVSQNRDLLIKAELQPKYFNLLSGITSANIRVLNSNITYSLEELDGKVISFGKSADMNNPLIPVTFQVKNSVGFLPGTFVEMYIKTLSNSKAITIPNESIVEEMGNYFAFIQLTPEYFEKRAITKGTTDGFRTEIREGISSGERVVSKGAILVKLTQSSGALDVHSGHVH